jgi:phenylpropionate dioxygenase-like ring-hydroxylating dioxygenase large terminal subunit
MAFVFNAWYMAAWSGELNTAPVGRTILGRPVVIFRTESGEIGALSDACPHRAVPLSRGSVAGSHIRCAYHALEFDVSGICRHNPHVEGPSDRIKTRSYPVAQRHGMAWIWMGDPAQANPDAIVDYHWFNEPERLAVASGYVKIAADYRLVIDNLMDLAHAEYIHQTTVGTPGAASAQRADVIKGDGSVSVNSAWLNLPPSAAVKQMWTHSERVDQYQDMTWRPVGNLFLDVAVTAPGDPRTSGLHLPSAHILTPETERSTHYFWASGRDFDISNEALTAVFGETVGHAFGTEDKPILEEAQRMLDATGPRLLNLTAGDAGSARVRLEIDQLASSEAAT